MLHSLVRVQFVLHGEFSYGLLATHSLQGDLRLEIGAVFFPTSFQIGLFLVLLV
jgi:hypothetical protein